MLESSTRIHLRNRAVDAFVLGALVVITLIAYSNSFQGAFLQDDYETLLNNPQLPFYLESFENVFTSKFNSRGITMWSFALNRELLGESERSYHIGNLLIHILGGIMLFYWLAELVEYDSGKRTLLSLKSFQYVPWYATTLFMLHPIQVQAVTYLSQRSEALMAMFLFLSLLGLVKAVKATSTAGWWFWMTICVSACGLGMRAKEAMIVAPFLLLLTDFAWLSSSWKELLKQRGLIHLCLWITLMMNPSWTQLIPKLPDFSISQITSSDDEVSTNEQSSSTRVLKQRGSPFTRAEYLKTQPGVILEYLLLVVRPTSLCFDKGHVDPHPYAWFLAGCLLIGLLSTATVIAIPQFPRYAYWGIWFIVCLAPRSSIIPLVNAYFEYRMYVPLVSIGVCGGVFIEAVLIRNLAERHQLLGRCLLLGLMATILASGTYQRNTIYSDPVLLWRNTVENAPGNSRAWTNLCRALVVSGKPDLVKESIEAGKQAIKTNPSYSKAHYMYGYALQNNGQDEEAISEYRTAVELSPGSYHAQLNLGILLHSKNPIEAIQHYEKALELSPGSRNVRINLATLRLYQGIDVKNSEAMLIKVSEEFPKDADSRRNLSMYYDSVGREEESRYWAGKLKELRPNDPWISKLLDSK